MTESAQQRIATTLGRSKRALMIGAVLGAALGLVIGLQLAGAVYTSSAQVLLSSAGATDKSNSAYDNNQYVTQRMSTYAAIATSDRVTGPAARALGLTAADLAPRITATAADGTTVLTVAVRGPNPEDAARAATAVTRALVGEITGADSPPGQPPRVTAQVIVAPVAAPPRPLPPLAVFLAGGALVGCGLALLAASAAAATRVRTLMGAALQWLNNTHPRPPGPPGPPPADPRSRPAGPPSTTTQAIPRGAPPPQRTGAPADQPTRVTPLP